MAGSGDWLVHTGSPCQTDCSMGWVGYVIAWVVAALFWAMAASWGSSRPPRETLLYGFLAMGTAGVMGVGVWSLSGRLEWSWRSSRSPPSMRRPGPGPTSSPATQHPR